MAETPKEEKTKGSLLMDELLGLLRIRVKRGVNLAVRDVRSSDPYVVVKMGKQKLKTRVIKKDVNPEWNEDLTLSVMDPSVPIKMVSSFVTISMECETESQFNFNNQHLHYIW
ncbi:protein C2-DOMAIN ABA-RELATED 4-like [Hibiscus syriacus]|uniref:protein C2-DOMAIN ABA-RELATED 4-like n=1 Tax=Hibiscus syriacus TaxID=106335 RepID=UPI001920AAAC|nr:protein C2-DOMAIN ABA-RELATED 4-like [Hibiscus syriacus]